MAGINYKIGMALKGNLTKKGLKAGVQATSQQVWMKMCDGRPNLEWMAETCILLNVFPVSCLSSGHRIHVGEAWSHGRQALVGDQVVNACGLLILASIITCSFPFRIHIQLEHCEQTVAHIYNGVQQLMREEYHQPSSTEHLV